MPKYRVPLDDGRTIEVEAANNAEAIQKQAALNANIKENQRWQAETQMPPVSSGEAFMLGAGRETDKLLSGVQDLFYAATGDDAAREALAGRQAMDDQIFQDVQEQAPFASAAGGILPYLAVPTARALPTIGAAAGMGATRYGDDRIEQGATDAALASLPFGAGRAYRAVRPRLMDPGTSTSMVSRADEIGWPLSPGDRSGLKALKVLESSIDATPMPLNPMHRMHSRRQQAVNRAAAEAIGERPGPVTDEVLGSAADRIGGAIEDLEFQGPIPVDDTFAARLVDVQDASRQALFKDPDIARTVDRVFDYVDEGYLRPEDYQRLSSQLKAKIRSAFRGDSPDPDFAQSLQDIVDILDDVAENGMSGQALKDLRTARQQWKALKSVEKAAHESGDVSGPRLANELRRRDKGGYLRGRNRTPLYETARMSRAFPARPDSGTAGRLTLTTPGGLLAAAASPATTILANTYMYGGRGLGALGRGMREAAPAFSGTPLLSRGLAGYQEEENVPYLYPGRR